MKTLLIIFLLLSVEVQAQSRLDNFISTHPQMTERQQRKAHRIWARQEMRLYKQQVKDKPSGEGKGLWVFLGVIVILIAI